MQRVALVLLAVLIGAAAPARAWCEATCLAPAAASSQAHCPSHESTPAGVSMSATTIEDCPVVDAARPTTIARPELKGAVATIESPQFRSTFAPVRVLITRHHPASAVERYTPLRI